MTPIVNLHDNRLLYVRSVDDDLGTNYLGVALQNKATKKYEFVLRVRHPSGRKNVWQGELSDGNSSDEACIVHCRDSLDRMFLLLIKDGFAITSDKEKEMPPSYTEEQLIEELKNTGMFNINID